jgi:copper chaperone
MQQVFEVQGMTCGHCEKAVTQALQRLDPLARIVIDRPQGRVEVDSQLSREALARAIVDEGYPVAA